MGNKNQNTSTVLTDCYKCVTLNSEVMQMKTETQRINVQFSKEKYELIEHLAELENVSLSEKVRQLIESALENAEDMNLMMIAEKRLSKYNRKNVLKKEDIIK